MGALAPVVSWIPEDDLLLKNAVEAGASLESLAKGAVQFSRRFSIRELQDRWHSLLYDPVISAEASFRMTELERTYNPNFLTKFARTGYGYSSSKENNKSCSSSSKKRNADEKQLIRSRYHSLRKKFRTEPFNSLDDLGFLVNGDVNATHLDGLLEASDMDIIHNAFPDILAGSEDNLQQGAIEPKTEMANSTDCFLAELTNTLFEDVEKFMEVVDDGKEVVDKTYYDGLSSLLENPVNNDTQTHDLDMMLELDDGTTSCKSSMSALDLHPEIVDGVINCVLNREDDDIPCNDDVFLSTNNSHPKSVSSLARRNFKDSTSSNPMTTTTACVNRDVSASRERCEGYSSIHTQKKIPPPRLQASSSQGKPEIGIKFRAPPTNAESQNTVTPTGSASNTLVSDGTVAKDGNKELAGHGSYSEKDKEENSVLPLNELPHAKDTNDDGLMIEVSDHPVLEITTRTEAEAEEGHVFVSDDEDLPNYSDIEAMILDMDLDPDDQDNFDLEVSKYQGEDVKRRIIRLEQAAHSYMQRDIASCGAFAVLYGRYSKHYIKKPEVLVGRSTEDLAVDIDLGREKRGSKISRRQAMIRLSDDGSFHMKNLGKYSISVNEKEVDPGQSLILKSDCLVEIRGMPFIFEANQSRIKEYLERRSGKVN